MTRAKTQPCASSGLRRAAVLMRSRTRGEVAFGNPDDRACPDRDASDHAHPSGLILELGIVAPWTDARYPQPLVRRDVAPLVPALIRPVALAPSWGQKHARERLGREVPE